jgi:hypothetical protein
MSEEAAKLTFEEISKLQERKVLLAVPCKAASQERLGVVVPCVTPGGAEGVAQGVLGAPPRAQDCPERFYGRCVVGEAC